MLPSLYKAALFQALAIGLAGWLPAAALTGADSAGTGAGDAGIQKTLDNILAKEGISMGGAFRSQYLHSSISGPSTVDTRRSEEGVEYTSVDFDIRARPNTATQGRLIVRMHQDWRNFFSDIGNPINTRWISIDGNMKGMYRYNAGDYKQKYSPLTLYTAEPDVMYEPTIFASDRQEAMDEAFVGGHERLLQGVNLNFDAALDRGSNPLLREIHFNLMGSRLRNVDISIQNGNKTTDNVEAANAEKYLAASNLDLTLPVGASLGGSYLLIFDKKGSFASTGGNPDTAAQWTSIVAGRAGYDLATLTGAKDWNIGISAEYAMSKDDTNWFAAPNDSALTKSTIDGSALLARLYGSWKPGRAFGVKVGVNYLKNEANYRNELAQSPVFIGERILNIENDSTPLLRRTDDVRTRNYSTFDAMYQHVFKFSPSAATNLWQKAPFSKNAYNSSIMTQGEMAAFAALRADTALQLIMPFGPATPNRGGIQSDVTLSFLDDRIEAQALFASLENVTGVKVDSVRALPVTKFAQMGGGLKIEAGALIGLSLPFTLSGSFIRSSAENGGIAADTSHPSLKVTSDFINAGMQYSFWKRFALLGGYQKIENTINHGGTEAKQTQIHYAGGLDYKVAAGAHLLFSLGRVSVDNPAGPVDTDFSQLQTDLFLTVHF